MENNSQFFGWVDDPVLREEAFSSLPEDCKRPFQIKGATADIKRMMLFEVVRKTIGQEPEESNVSALLGSRRFKQEDFDKS